MRVIQVRFPSGGRQYDYYVQPGDNPEIGDLVLTSHIESSEEDSFRATGIGVVRGLLIEGAPHKASKPYLFLIPMKLLKQRIEERQRFAEFAEAQALARAQLQAKVKKQNELAVFEALAANDPEAAQLLEILKATGPTMLAIEWSVS